MDSLMVYENRRMNRKEKRNWTMAAFIGLLLLLVSWKKKPVGDVEVGQGEFGEFGTDGIWSEDLTPDNIIKTPDYVPAKGSAIGKDLGLLYEDMVKSTYASDEKGCSTCF